MTNSEIEITADLVRELLQEQHPDLAGLAIREVAGGWGNQMWRLGDELAVRMQRMAPTSELQLKERRWLPVLAPRLPLPVPTPVRIGEPSARFPKHWTVMTWVPGEPLDYTSISRGDHAADTLAGFLRALHVEAPAEAPTMSDRGDRYPQLYSRVGFVHHYRPLSPNEQHLVIARHWPHLALDDLGDFTTAEAVATITRITSGNFRLTSRLVAQIERVMDINQLSTVTAEVVETARESLVVGVL